MQNLQDIHDKIFFETKSILETLCKINSKDELLSRQDLFAELTDRIAFLRILEKNEDQFSLMLKGGNAEGFQDDNLTPNVSTGQDGFNETEFKADLFEEEVIFTNDLNDFEEEIQTEEKYATSMVDYSDDLESNEIQNDSISESDLSPEDEIPLIIEQEESDYAQRVAQKEKDLEELEERRRKIVEITKPDVLPTESNIIPEQKADALPEHLEKKFKLANIKGLRVVQHLFDNDPLEDEKEQEKPKPELGSLLKANVRTDFMEAERKKPEFRLDLNDKVAFTKSLFAGDADELKLTIDKLNSFSNLEDAKNYLSEVYYRKDWAKADEYAQRLWNLVENKFM